MPRLSLRMLIVLAAVAVAAIGAAAVLAVVMDDDGDDGDRSGIASLRRDALLRRTPRPAKDPKLESQLLQLADALDERGRRGALRAARGSGQQLVGRRVRVEIEVLGGRGTAAAHAVRQSGGEVEAQAAGLIQALVPLAALQKLADENSIGFIRSPLRSQPHAILGEGVNASGARQWQQSGLNGAGVTVAVIDLGFGGWRGKRITGDLPASVTTRNFCYDRPFEGDNAEIHGTGVGEIVFEMAPRARLILICADTPLGLNRALAFIKQQDVDIVNYSVGWWNSGRGDGRGIGVTPDTIVANARASGILWVNSAGNEAQTHWSGRFSDPNGNRVHDFRPGDEGNRITIEPRTTACVFLKWDDWPRSTNDYDMVLVHVPSGRVAASSEGAQNGRQPPTETICYQNGARRQVFYIAIQRARATATPRFDLFVNKAHSLEYTVPAGSVTEPASSRAAFAVAAVCWRTGVLEAYSSRGPTVDGRMKPDIASVDSVSNSAYGPFTGTCGSDGFTGTSAASPHVAGAAALVKQANPSFGPSQIQAFLEGRAADAGPSGRDNQFGVGKLTLGPPQR